MLWLVLWFGCFHNGKMAGRVYDRVRLSAWMIAHYFDENEGAAQHFVRSAAGLYGMAQLTRAATTAGIVKAREVAEWWMMENPPRRNVVPKATPQKALPYRPSTPVFNPNRQVFATHEWVKKTIDDSMELKCCPLNHIDFNVIANGFCWDLAEVPQSSIRQDGLTRIGNRIFVKNIDFELQARMTPNGTTPTASSGICRFIFYVDTQKNAVGYGSANPADVLQTLSPASLFNPVNRERFIILDDIVFTANRRPFNNTGSDTASQSFLVRRNLPVNKVHTWDPTTTYGDLISNSVIYLVIGTDNVSWDYTLRCNTYFYDA